VILEFDASGNLPPGVHQATWMELEERFGTTPWRRALLAGLSRALGSLRAAGCRRVYVDGSFVTTKDAPGDFDVCWEAAGVDPTKLDPVLLDFSNRRAAQKAAYGGELFPAETAAEPSGTRFLDYFQRDHRTGEAKGIVTIDLAELP
jgi:hypothetical protein